MHEDRSRTLTHKILIIGENCISRKGVTSIVRGVVQGATTAEATCMRDAKQHLEGQDFLAAIFLIDMQSSSSVDYFRSLRVDHPHIVLAVISRASNAADILAHLAAGVNGYIPGDSNQSELECALRTVLTGTIYVPPNLAWLTSPQPNEGLDTPCQNPRGLTGRQSAVLNGLLKGYSNKAIARELDLSPNTVKIHVGAVLRHFAVQRRSDLAVVARTHSSGVHHYAAHQSPSTSLHIGGPL